MPFNIASRPTDFAGRVEYNVFPGHTCVNVFQTDCNAGMMPGERRKCRTGIWRTTLQRWKMEEWKRMKYK